MISQRKAILLLTILPITLVGAGYVLWTNVLENYFQPKEIEKQVQITIKEPETEKEMFDLAEVQKTLKRYDDAAKWYEARIDKGGDKEEVWYAKVMLADCYDNLKDWEQALYWYLDAYQSNPERAEPLMKIASHYRFKGDNYNSFLFAKQASTIPFPDANKSQHISPDIYNFLCNEELSIVAFYTPFKEEGFIAANNIILKKGLSTYTKDQAYRNIIFYVPKLKNTTIYPYTINLPALREGSPLHYNQMNASIKKADEGYDLICRTVNYSNTGKGIVWLDPNDQTWRCKNYLVHMDNNFQIQSQREITESLPRPRVRYVRAEGIEDPRIFEWKNKRWFSCTTTDTNPIGPQQMSLCRIESATEDTVKVGQMISLQGTDQKRIEKNWLPFVKDNEVYLIYSFDPFLVLKPNMDTGAVENYVHYVPTLDLSRLRGSAGPIEFDGGYLILAHEVAINSGYHYLHRFIYTDKNFEIKKLSKPFIFQHLGVEYCCGMTLDHTGTKLILPISKEDKEAFLLFVDLDTVRNTLEPLPTRIL